MSLPYKIPLKSDAPTYGRSAPREEEEEQPKQQPKEQPRRSGPSRHSESTAQHGYWADIDGGAEKPETAVRRISVEEERPVKAGAEPMDEEKLKQQLALLLGGKRAGYAASMLEEDNPYRESRSGEHYVPMGGHGSKTFSEQFTEADEGMPGFNAEESALIRERDRLDPYGKPTEKEQVKAAAQEKIVDEWKRRRSGRR